MMDYETKVTRARDRAIDEDFETSVFWTSPTTGIAYGRKGDVYQLTVDGDIIRCSCPGGQHPERCVCWHAEGLRMKTKPADAPAEDEQPKRERGTVCPSCAGAIDPKTDICLTGRLFGGCDYNAKRSA